MSQLAKSRWRFSGIKHVDGFLTALGIPYRSVKGESFWDSNAHLLPELYKELQDEVRSKFRELHPDTGGDEESFKDFISTWNKVKRIFSRYLQPALATPSNVEIIPLEKTRSEREKKQREQAVIYRRRYRQKKRRYFIKRRLSHMSSEKQERYWERSRIAKKVWERKAAVKRVRRHEAANPEKTRKRKREWAAKWRKEVLPNLSPEKQREYRRKAVVRVKQWVSENRAKHYEHVKKWSERNPENGRERSRRWRQRKKQLVLVTNGVNEIYEKSQYESGQPKIQKPIGNNGTNENCSQLAA